DSPTCALSGRPMFPPTVTLKPAVSRIRPVSAVVVDLPFVPVMAITRPCSQRDASSISAITGMPLARAASITGCSVGTPGLTTTGAETRRREGLEPVTTELETDAKGLQRIGRRNVGLRLRQRHARAAAREQFGGGQTAPRRARDGHLCAIHVKSHDHQSVHNPR